MANQIADRKEGGLLYWIAWLIGWVLLGASIGVIVINFGIEFRVDSHTGELTSTNVPRSQLFSSYAAWVSIFAAVCIPLSFLIFPRKILAWLFAIVVASTMWIGVASVLAARTATPSDWLSIIYVGLLLIGIGVMGGFAPRTSPTLPGWAPYLAAGAVAATISFLATPYVGKLALGERLDMNAAARMALDIGAGAGWTILYAPLFLGVLGAFAAGATALLVLALRLGRKRSAGGG